MRRLIVCMVAGICAVSAWANKVVSTSLALAADLDYSGETLVVNDGVTIDLKGHDLIVSALDGQSAGAGEITDSVGGGRLRVRVAASDTTGNAKVKLTGGLRLVKEGGGTFAPTYAGQTYVGGTEVVEGTFKANHRNLYGPDNSSVVIRKDGTFDVADGYNNYNTCFTLDGGTILNSGTATGYVLTSYITLTADSTMRSARNGRLDILNNSFNHTRLALNGHTLTLDLNQGTMQMCNCTIDKGTIHLVSGTLFSFANGDSAKRNNGPEVTFIGEAGTTLRTDNNGHLMVKTLTTRGNLTGGNWFDAEVWTFEAAGNQAGNVALGEYTALHRTAKVVKRGPGQTTIGGNHNQFTGGMLVEEGSLKAVGKNCFGNGGMIEVRNGAWLDGNGQGGGYVAPATICGDGDGNGAIQDTSATAPAFNLAHPITDLTLAGDASVGCAQRLIFINQSYNPIAWNLGRFNLTKKGAGTLYLSNTTLDGKGTFTVAAGSLAAVDTITANVPTVFKNGATLDLSVPYANKGAKFTFADCTFEPGAKLAGSAAGANLTFSGRVTGAADFPCASLRLAAGATLVLPAGKAKFTTTGSFGAAGAATLDVSALFAAGEPAGSSVTVLEAASGLAGCGQLSLAGASEGWALAYDGATLKLVKGEAPATLPQATGTTPAAAGIDATTVFAIPAETAARLEPGVYTLASWTTPTYNYGQPQLVLDGCPYETELICTFTDVKLLVKSAADVARKPVSIWTLGDERVLETGGYGFRLALAQKLALAGWNVEMRGLRTDYANEPSGATAKPAWQGHTGINGVCWRTWNNGNGTGLLEGLDTYAAQAGDPDYTFMFLGTWQYWDDKNITSDQLFNHWKAAMDHILAACPHTTIIATTMMTDTTGQSGADPDRRNSVRNGANAKIRDLVAKTEAQGGFPTGRVAFIDFQSLLDADAAYYRSNWLLNVTGYEKVASELAKKLLTLGTAAGRNGAPAVAKVRNDLALADRSLAVTFTKPLAAVPATASLAETAGGATCALTDPILSDDGRTVTYQTAQTLTARTGYTLTVGGFADTDGTSVAETTYAFEPRVFGAENNVPAAYLAGFEKLAVLEPTAQAYYPQSKAGVPYAWRAADLPLTGVTKAGYYIELVRRSTGEMKCMWIDCDAPGASFYDMSLPVTLAQRRQQTVTKLHVWSDFGGVDTVAATDNSVAGYLEFNPINYSGGAKNLNSPAAETWGGSFDWNDTMSESGATGYGCFQIFRKAPSSGLPAEALFVMNRWGDKHTDNIGIGFGTLANNKRFDGNVTLDRTHLTGTSYPVAHFNGGAYSTMRIEFWAQYTPPASRTGYTDATWTGAADTSITNPANWGVSAVADKMLLVPAGATPTFTYAGVDPVNLSGSALYLDGKATFASVGALAFGGLNGGATGRLVFDPTKVSLRVANAPVFAPGFKFALDARYATATKGRFLLLSYDAGTIDLDATALTALFETTSAAGNAPKVWVETLASGGRLWLDLDAADDALTPIRVLPMGDSITHGSIGSYGNWRIPLMKKLNAAGYDVTSTGIWADQSADENGLVMPEKWNWHSGFGGKRLITSGGAGGVQDTLEVELDQAGDVDVVLLKIGTNDLNGGTDADTLFTAWVDTVRRILAQSACKVVAGAVLNIADAAKNAQVTAFNAKMQQAIAGGTFPAGRVFFADLYNACPRYNSAGGVIEGNFYTATDLHPDWPGEDAMAEEYARVVQLALANGLPVHPAPETTTGCENNVPDAYRAGFKRARVYDMLPKRKFAPGDEVPYEDATGMDGATEDLARVGYYIELKRKNTAITDYGDRVRWLWVDMTAFGNRDLASVGLPLNHASQDVVSELHVVGNMPGIATVAPDDSTVKGFVEFWPWDYGTGTSNLAGAPADAGAYDWNDTCNWGGSYSSMQVHRLNPAGSRLPAQVLFAYNHWRVAEESCIGLGNYACHQGGLRSWDWTHIYRGSSSSAATVDSGAYEVGTIEIWTRSRAEEQALTGVSALLWRPESGANSIATDVPAWVDARGARQTAQTGAELMFDGQDRVSYTVTTPTAFSAGAVTVTGDRNYVFAGDGALTAGTLTINPAANTTITVNGAGVHANAITIKSGVLKLGDSLQSDALGKGPDGVVTILAGGQFDLAYAAEGDDDVTRCSAAYNKTFHIAGDGPDGSGAIYNSNTSARWFTALGRVVLDADASIGGTGRIDFRSTAGGRSYTGRPQLTGPGKVLTVRVRTSTNQGLNFNNADVNVQKIVIDAGSQMGLEGTVNLEVPDGIELLDGAQLDFWGGVINGTSEVRVAPGATATLRGLSGTPTLNLPFVLPEDSTLYIDGASAITFAGGFTGGGKVIQKNGTYTFGEAPEHEGLTVDTDKFNFVGGTLYVGNPTKGGIPSVAQADFSGDNGGTLVFGTSIDDTIDGAKFQVNRPKGTVVFTGSVTEGEISDVPCLTLKDADWTASALHVGNATYPGNLRLDNSRITVDRMRMQDGGNFYPGKLELVNGSMVTVNAARHAPEEESVSIASTTSLDRDQESLVIVGADSTFSVPNGLMVVGWSSRYARFEMNEGSTVDLWGVVGRRRYNGVNGVTDHDSIFRMNGGTLNIGPAGFLHGYFAYSPNAVDAEVLRTHVNESGPLFRLNNGTLRATADTETSASFNSPGVDIAFGDVGSAAGAVTIDTNGHTLDLRTGLKGYSDVRVTGGGTLKTSREAMGIPRGRWTIDAGVDAELYGAAGFAGGLTLEANAAARVWAQSTSLVEAYSGSQEYTALFETNCFTHFATDLAYLNMTKHSTGPSYHTYAYRGEFLVTEANAGTWYFYGQWDDRVRLDIDGKTVLAATADCGAASGHIALAAGWHSFIVAARDGYGGQGPTTWSTTMGVGYRVGSDGGSTAANYKKFDTDTLAMRPQRVLNWWNKHYDADWAVYGFSFIDPYPGHYDFMATTNSVKMWANSGSVGNAAFGDRYVKRSNNRVTGSIYVGADQAGLWTFKLGGDDFYALLLDGEIIAGVPSWTYQVRGTWAATPGWHEFEIYYGDTSGGYGPNGYSGVASKYPLTVSVNGAADVTFDEDHFQLGLTPFVGVAGETELKAGSTLANDGPAAYPITGTVWGSGTFAGKFAFTGGHIGLVAQGNDYSCPQYQDAAADTFKDLGGVDCAFTGAPQRGSYRLGPAMGLTDEAARALPVSVSITGVDNDKAALLADRLYLKVQPNGLYLMNPMLSSTVLFFR